MKIGLQLPSFCTEDGSAAIGSRLREIADVAESCGFSSLWVMDHYFQIPLVGPVEQEMLEGYSTLSYLAGLTSQIKLGTLVTGVTYRHPGVLVKTVTTLDVLSDGRAYLGIGAAWFDREHHGLGIPYPPMGERFERLEETLEIVKQMWSDENGRYSGRHYQLEETLCAPQPLSTPHPPILIGGGGERKTLRLVAQYGDACNLFALIGVAEVARKLEVLKRHCDDVGRDYAEIEKTTLGITQTEPGVVRPGEILASCQEQAEIGIEQTILGLPNLDEIASVEAIGREVIPEVAEL
ncbi:MAG: LLM class F420-dependent oxidoreductase [Deltaproteobacteria bacterium]|nr:LLM class F420-dependent oxidoreductase [Deltaproteobacteria bacterium]